MNCWHCKTELIWGGDGDDEFATAIITNLSCPNCPTTVFVHYDLEENK